MKFPRPGHAAAAFTRRAAKSVRKRVRPTEPIGPAEPLALEVQASLPVGNTLGDLVARLQIHKFSIRLRKTTDD